MAVDVLLGLQWGDEGKGKIVDVLTSKYDIIARFQGFPVNYVFNNYMKLLNAKKIKKIRSMCAFR